MTAVEVSLPAGIGDMVLVHRGELAGQVAMVVAWRVTRPRFLLGGGLDGTPHLSVMVITDEGEDCWLGEAEVTTLSAPAVVTFDLPFFGGDAVVVLPERVPGEVRGWEVTGRRLETQVVYWVHLDGTPAVDEVEIDAVFLETRLQT